MSLSQSISLSPADGMAPSGPAAGPVVVVCAGGGVQQVWRAASASGSWALEGVDRGGPRQCLHHTYLMVECPGGH